MSFRHGVVIVIILEDPLFDSLTMADADSLVSINHFKSLTSLRRITVFLALLLSIGNDTLVEPGVVLLLLIVSLYDGVQADLFPYDGY